LSIACNLILKNYIKKSEDGGPSQESIDPG